MNKLFTVHTPRLTKVMKPPPLSASGSTILPGSMMLMATPASNANALNAPIAANAARCHHAIADIRERATTIVEPLEERSEDGGMLMSNAELHN